MTMAITKGKTDFVKFILDQLLWIILVAIFVFFTFWVGAGKFLSGTNLINILLHATVLGILVIGQSICLLSKNFDLSAEGTVSLVTVFAAYFMVPIKGFGGGGGYNINPLIIIPVMLIIGSLAGFINGFLITRFRMNNFIVTLSMQLVLRGLAYVISGGLQIDGTPPLFNFLGTGTIGPIPFAIIFTPLLFVIVDWYLKKSLFGRQLYAVGSNSEAAKASGFNPARVVTIAYMISGFMAALAGWMLLGRVQSSYSKLGAGFTLETVAASVIGGISLQGGLGSVGRAFSGVMLLSVVDNGLNLMDVNPFWVNGIRGFIILLALVIDSQKVRYKPKVVVSQAQAPLITKA
jgi:ribose/xylose/arabinose/galactoside ABC-type transport system permease subunit